MNTILVVEDDKKTAAALAIRITAAGYTVLTAPDGLEGLKLAIRHRPDLILMDVWMPGGLGFLTAQRLKHVGLENIPVIFLTAGKEKDLWKIAAEVGAAGFFEKPYDPKQLLQCIALTLARAPSLASPSAARPQPSKPNRS